MKINFSLSLFILFNIISFSALSESAFDSNFINVNIETINAKESKNESINKIINISLQQLSNKILTNKSNKKFDKLIDSSLSKNQLIKNIIIEDEIITNEKYIANIKINFDHQKVINLLINNKINYTDLISKPFLIISSYNISFNNIALDKNNILHNYLKNKEIQKSKLINFTFPYLDANDRYILDYKKIINEDSNSFDKILNKYNLNQLIYINISKSHELNELNIVIKSYDNKIFNKISEFKFNRSNYNSNELFDNLSDNILSHIIEWWKNQYLINVNDYSTFECKIISNNFDDLIKIKSVIKNFSQVKNFIIKNVQLNMNNVEFFYYGDIEVLLKSFSLSNLFYKNENGCIITTI